MGDHEPLAPAAPRDSDGLSPTVGAPRAGPSAGGAATVTQSEALTATSRRTQADRQLAARDGAGDVAPYPAALDGLERRLRQRREVVAECATSGIATPSQMGIT